MEIIIFCGIQASGKTSFYAQHFLKTHVRVSMDLLRTRYRENRFLDTCFSTMQKLVVDNTNPTAAERERYINPAKEAGYKIIGYYFQSKIEEAMKRNAERTGKECIVEKAIAATYKRLELPKLDEGFNELYYVSIEQNGEFQIQKWTDEI